jgi:hypothetical protein
MFSIILMTIIGALFIAYLGYVSAGTVQKHSDVESRSRRKVIHSAIPGVKSELELNRDNPEAMKMAEGGSANNGTLTANHSR